VGKSNDFFGSAAAIDKYVWCLYWSVITFATVVSQLLGGGGARRAVVSRWWRCGGLRVQGQVSLRRAAFVAASASGHTGPLLPLFTGLW
jgi:hypothetical protein